MLLLLCAGRAKAGELPHPVSIPDTIRILVPDSVPQPDSAQAVAPAGENKKLIAALLAFPIPFGITGLHRVYLGTAPWVPVVYFVTLGGCGILPLMDFIFILTATNEELESYANNGKVFMWVK